MNKLKGKGIFIIAAVLVLIIVVIAFYSGFYDFFAEDKSATGDFVTFLDVGQSRCTLICNDGRYILINAGDRSDDGYTIEKKLYSLGIKKIDFLVLTDVDIGGTLVLLDNFGVEAIAYSQEFYDGVISEKLNKLIDEYSVTRHALEAGKSLSIGDASMDMLWLYDSKGYIVRLNIESKKFLFPANVLSRDEKEMLKSEIDLDCDVFVASNNGSLYSNCGDLLDAATPQICIVSCSQKKQPTKTFKKRLENRNIRLYTTAKHGDITFHLDDDSISYKK